MKDLLRALIDATVVDKSTLTLMRMWGVDVDDVDKAVQGKELLSTMVDDIARMIEGREELPDMKESELDLEAFWKENNGWVNLHDTVSGAQQPWVGAMDGVRRVVFEYHRELFNHVRPGVVCHHADRSLQLLSLELRYEGDKPKYVVGLGRPYAEV
jgi:hypothetical protein